MSEPIRWELNVYRGKDKVGKEVFSGQSMPATPSQWDDALIAFAPHIARAERTATLRALIQAFVVKEEFWKACGNDERKAGVRECVTHLQEVLKLNEDGDD